MKKKIGIITYHAAYNYGSVLQAIATQEVVRQLGYIPEIINYRMIEQRRFYSLYRKNYGIKNWVKDIMQFPICNKRKQRAELFEKFIAERMNLSEEFSDPSQFKKISRMYDVIISGSDQIWNKHSCELEHNEWKFMNPYLLVGAQCKKISYASSIAQMSDEEIKKILPALKDICKISMREEESAKRIGLIFKRKISTVLDPTFLLTRSEWLNLLNIKDEKEENYILYYSLDGIVDMKKRINYLVEYAKKRNLRLVMVTPYSYLPRKEKFVELCPESGPIEFITLLMKAKTVITDSYHGTILSVNFKKDFYSLCKQGGAEFRKTDILKRIGLSERVVYNIADFLQKEYKCIDYITVEKRVMELREMSKNYLVGAI